jgi:hypothetical protein
MNSLLVHKPIEFEAIIIGGRRVIVSAKTAEKIRIRREALKRKDARIAQEMKAAHLLPTQTVTNGRHASYIAEPFNTRKHKPENMISLDDAKHKGIEAEYKQYVHSEARKHKLI